MDTDDLDLAVVRQPILAKRDLEVMSVEALGDYVQELKDEIQRAEQAISSKSSARNAAESFFKKR